MNRKERRAAQAGGKRRSASAPAAVDPDFVNAFVWGGGCSTRVFPTQESRFTLPQIQAFLDANGLKFLGFAIGQVRDQFALHHPRQQETDLQLWHQFETAHPDLFKNMYQFWVQRS
jgi:hypothetical protein